MPFLLYPFVERRWQCATFISYHWWCSCAMWTVCVDDSRPLGLHCTQCHNDGVSATAVAVAAICMHQLKMLSKEIIIALREQKRRNFERSAWQPEYDFVFFFFLLSIWWMVGWMDRVARKSINQIMVEWMKQKLFSFLRMQLARPLFRSIRVNVELWAVHMCERVNGLTHTVVDSEGE